DGIRDFHVTGVQTCALPIWRLFDIRSLFKISYLKKLEDAYRTQQQTVLIGDQAITLLAPELQILQVNIHILKHLLSFGIGLRQRSEERRVGKECRFGWWGG